MTSCVDVQYRTNVDIVGGSETVQIYADVIYGWSLTYLGLLMCRMKFIISSMETASS